MKRVTAILLATTMSFGVAGGVTAQDAMETDTDQNMMMEDFALDGATVADIEAATSATAISLPANFDADEMLPANIDELQQALNTNTSLTVFFEQQGFDASAVRGVDVDEDGSLMIYVNSEDMEEDDSMDDDDDMDDSDDE